VQKPGTGVFRTIGKLSGVVVTAKDLSY